MAVQESLAWINTVKATIAGNFSPGSAREHNRQADRSCRKGGSLQAPSVAASGRSLDRVRHTGHLTRTVVTSVVRMAWWT